MAICQIHQKEKDKTDKKGRSYHWAEDSVMCWGDAQGFNVKLGEKVIFEDVPSLQSPFHAPETPTFYTGRQPDPAEEFKKSLGEEEERPMTRKDWNEKEFVKGLAVYSSQARQEGMDPVTAFKTMHIAEWLRLAYGDLQGFDEWIQKVKNRLKNLGEE